MGERELAEKIRKEDREYRVRENRKNQRELAQILFVGIKAGTELREPQDPQMGEKEKPKRQALKKDQCTYCKEQGHWKNECPKRDPRTLRPRENLPWNSSSICGGRQ